MPLRRDTSTISDRLRIVNETQMRCRRNRRSAAGKIRPRIELVPALRDRSPFLRGTAEPVLVEQFAQHVAVHVVDVEAGIDRVGHPAQRAAAMLVRQRMPVALDTVRGAPCRHRRGQAGMPVEHRAAGVEGKDLYVFHALLSRYAPSRPAPRNC